MRWRLSNVLRIVSHFSRMSIRRKTWIGTEPFCQWQVTFISYELIELKYPRASLTANLIFGPPNVFITEIPSCSWTLVHVRFVIPHLIVTILFYFRQIKIPLPLKFSHLVPLFLLRMLLRLIEVNQNYQSINN